MSARQSSTAKVTRHRQVRLFGFDHLEDRRLMAADLGQPAFNSQPAICFFLSSSAHGTAEVSPAPKSTTPVNHSAPKHITPQHLEVKQVLPGSSTKVGSAATPEQTMPKDNGALTSHAAPTRTQETGKQAAAPTTTSSTPSDKAAKPSVTSNPTTKQPLIGLKTPSLESTPEGDADYSGEIYFKNLQDTNVSTSGTFGTAKYTGKTDTIGASGSLSLEDDASQGKLSAKAEGDASLLKTEHKAEYQMPVIQIGGQDLNSNKFTANGSALIGVKGSAEAGVAWNGTDAGLKSKAEVFVGIEVKGDVGVENRLLGVKTDAGADGYARAGAEASGEANLTMKEGLDLNAKAFAGAKAGGTVKSSIAGIGVSAGGEAWAGAGGEASLAFKKGENGTYGFHTSLGAAPGLGGKGEFGIEVNPEEVAKVVDVPGKLDSIMAEVNGNEGVQNFNTSVNEGFVEAQDAVMSTFTSMGDWF